MRFGIAIVLLLVTVSCANAQLMVSTQQEYLLSAHPRLESEELDSILQGKKEGKYLFYTANEMVPAHQNSDPGRPFTGFFANSHNYSALAVRLGGNEPTGNAGEFPWKVPGGTDHAKIYTWKVMYLPPGTKVKVVSTTLSDPNVNVGRVRGYDWVFPVGTRFFELLSFGEELLVFEVRVRSKVSQDKWLMNCFRPFPESKDLESKGGNSEKLDSVGINSSFVSKSLGLVRFDDRRFHPTKAAIDVTAEQFVIGAIPNRSKLIRDQVFKTSMGKVWGGVGEYPGYAPTSYVDGSIVPKNYQGNFVGNSNKMCMNCHESCGEHVMNFNFNRDWYGFVHGSKTDKILSFQPFVNLSYNRIMTKTQINPKLGDFIE